MQNAYLNNVIDDGCDGIYVFIFLHFNQLQAFYGIFTEKKTANILKSIVHAVAQT